MFVGGCRREEDGSDIGWVVGRLMYLKSGLAGDKFAREYR